MDRDRPAPARPLWERVEALRTQNGWTRTQLAQRAGVARTTIDKWKTQPRAPLASTIKDVATALGLDLDETLRLAGIVPGQEEAPTLEEANARLREALDKLDESERRRKALEEENEQLRQSKSA
jgi:transcriptional regulator with XRE-family HTH domain